VLSPYAQDYEVHACPQAHLTRLQQGSLAINSFLGWPSIIGRSHGKPICGCSLLCAEGAPLVAIDPAEDNVRAARLRKGGLSRRSH
jgi:aminoglycoside 6'-N-acetyltransferase